MKRFCFIVLLSLFFTGCLTQLFIDGEVRLQIENRLENQKITELALVAMDSSDLALVWIQEEIFPKERSRVVARPYVGVFNLRLKIIDLDTDSLSMVYFPSVHLESGSLFVQISKTDGEWTFKQK